MMASMAEARRFIFHISIIHSERLQKVKCALEDIQKMGALQPDEKLLLEKVTDELNRRAAKE